MDVKQRFLPLLYVSNAAVVSAREALVASIIKLAPADRSYFFLQLNFTFF
jgi:hypothetical protein